MARSLWRCNGMLCTSGFMDDVTIARKLRARRRRPVEAQRTRSLGLGYKLCAVTKVAGLRTHGTTRGRSLRSVTALLILHGRHVVPRGLSSSWGSRLAKFHPPPNRCMNAGMAPRNDLCFEPALSTTADLFRRNIDDVLYHLRRFHSVCATILTKTSNLLILCLIPHLITTA